MANYIAVPSGSGNTGVWSGRGKLLGLSVRESAAAGAAASFVLRDGTDATGPPLAFFALAEKQSVNGDWGAIEGIEFVTGLYLERTAGATELTVYI